MRALRAALIYYNCINRKEITEEKGATGENTEKTR